MAQPHRKTSPLPKGPGVVLFRLPSRLNAGGGSQGMNAIRLTVVPPPSNHMLVARPGRMT